MAHTHRLSNHWSVPLLLSAGMETAPSSTKSEWATTTPSSLRNTKRSTPLIRSSSTRATTPRATTMTWPWFVCRQGRWVKCRESVCHSAAMFFPPVCQWRKRGCLNKPATVTSLAGVTQVRARGYGGPEGAKHDIASFHCCLFHSSDVVALRSFASTWKCVLGFFLPWVTLKLQI